MSLFGVLHDKGLWRGYERHIVSLEPVLVDMSSRGMPVNPDAFARTKSELEAKLAAFDAEIQTLIPLDLKPFQPKLGFKRTPKKLEGCVEHDFYDPPSFDNPAATRFTRRWVRLTKWKASNQSLTRYMRYRGHPVPKNFKNDKDTTNQLELARLARSTGDPLYAAVLRYRKVQTILKNHIKNWAPGPDGRVHSTFYFDPATGQLSSRRPNVQNAPHHDDPEYGGEYAEKFRSMVSAKEGCTILEFDYRAFHVQTLGFEAQDAEIMRMGRLDIHSFVTAHMLRLKEADALFGWPDDQLRDFLAWVKKNHKHTRDAKVKHALLGYNNGMGYKKLYIQYREFFNNQSEAKRVMDLLDSLFPKSKKYREAICQRAHEQGYLISRHGYIRYFWEVFRWKGRRGTPGDWSHGDDHEAALCFFTQNDAHGELKDRILVLREKGLDSRYGFINNIHDSLMFECPTSLVEEAIQIKSIMETPSTVLIDPLVAPHGLSVEVEAKGGPDWAHMKGLYS